MKRKPITIEITGIEENPIQLETDKYKLKNEIEYHNCIFCLTKHQMSSILFDKTMIKATSPDELRIFFESYFENTKVINKLSKSLEECLSFMFNAVTDEFANINIETIKNDLKPNKPLFNYFFSEESLIKINNTIDDILVSRGITSKLNTSIENDKVVISAKFTRDYKTHTKFNIIFICNEEVALIEDDVY